MITIVKTCLNLQNSKNRNIYIQMSLIISVFIKLKLYYIKNKMISLLLKSTQLLENIRLLRCYLFKYFYDFKK